MLPLTSSMYVNGTLASKESVLVDIGTGYYMEARSFAVLHNCSVHHYKDSLCQLMYASDLSPVP
jgi:hypothetical protein